MQKNVTSQKALFFAFDSTTNLPKTGDAANITAYVQKDWLTVNALGDTSATELDATNAKGYYVFDLTQGETNGDTLLFTAKSATANIVVVGAPAVVYTVPPNFSLESIDSSGRVDVIKIAGTTQTARDIGASVLLSSGTGTGQLDFTSGVVKANAVQLLGTAWLPPGTAGTPDVNTKLVGGTSQTGRDLGASVLLSSGTGTGQISLSSGTVTTGAISTGAITATAIADGAIDRATFAADTGLQSVRSSTAQAGGATSITLDASASSTTDFYKGQIVYLTGATGVGQSRIITAYNGTTKVATVTPAWATNPDVTSTFAILPVGCSDIVSTLGSTSVGAAGYVGIDWGQVTNKTTTNALTGTSISTSQTIATVTNQLTAAQIATGVWQDSTGTDFTTASSIGKALYTGNFVPGAAGGLFISGSNAGTTTVGALTITGATTHTGNVVFSDGITVSSPSTTNRAGINITGNGTGAGILCTGGAAVTTTAGGHGISVVGGASSTGAGGTAGVGILVTGGAGSASTNGAAEGVKLVGGGTNTVASNAYGLNVLGTSTGHGALFTSGGGSTGDGARFTAASTNGAGMSLVHAGTGSDFNATTTPLTLAKTTNITGFNDIAATAIVSSGAITTSGGAVSTVTTVTNQLTAAQIATGVWQDSTGTDFTTANSIGKALYINNVAPGGAGGHMISGTNAGTTTLAALTVTGELTVSDGIAVSCSTTNKSAATFTANGNSPGIVIHGGSSGGAGLEIEGLNGNGLNIFGDAGYGMYVAGTGVTGHALFLEAGSISANGLKIKGGSTSGDAISTSATSGTTYINANVTHIKSTASAGTAGYVGIDWANITAPTTSVNLSGTTISTSQQVASVSGSVGSVASGGITSASFATDAVSAAAVSAAAVAKIWAQAMTELSAVPGVTSDALSALSFIFETVRNKITQTATTQLVYKDDGTTTLATSTVSDDGTTFTRGKFS